MERDAWSLDESNASAFLKSNPDHATDDVDDSQDREDDPQLLSLGEQMGGLLGINDDASPDGDSLIRDEIDMPVSLSMGSIVSDNDDHSTFVDRFARINVVSNQNYPSTPPTLGDNSFCANLYLGYSKDDPVLFIHRCPNRGLGCTFTTPMRSYLLNDHLKRLCHFIPGAIAPPAKDFHCEYTGCSSSFAKKRDLQQHVSRIHKFRPRTCGSSGLHCDPDKIFSSQKELKAHWQRFHSFKPTECPIEGCKNSHEFETRESFTRHMKYYHPEETDYLIKRERAGPFRCPLPSCAGKTFGYPNKLLYHLRTKGHHLSPAEIDTYMANIDAYKVT